MAGMAISSLAKMKGLEAIAMAWAAFYNPSKVFKPERKPKVEHQQCKYRQYNPNGHSRILFWIAKLQLIFHLLPPGLIIIPALGIFREPAPQDTLFLEEHLVDAPDAAERKSAYNN